MKITITADGGSPVTLCDHGREGPSGLTIVPIRKVDILEYVRSDYAKPKHRGNTLHQLTFTVSKEHASYGEAQIYLFRRSLSVPADGVVSVEFDSSCGSVAIPDCTCEIAPLPCIGVLSTVGYTIKFGDPGTYALTQLQTLLDNTGATILTSDGKTILTLEQI